MRGGERRQTGACLHVHVRRVRELRAGVRRVGRVVDVAGHLRVTDDVRVVRQASDRARDRAVLDVVLAGVRHRGRVAADHDLVRAVELLLLLLLPEVLHRVLEVVGFLHQLVAAAVPHRVEQLLLLQRHEADLPGRDGVRARVRDRVVEARAERVVDLTLAREGGGHPVERLVLLRDLVLEAKVVLLRFLGVDLVAALLALAVAERVRDGAAVDVLRRDVELLRDLVVEERERGFGGVVDVGRLLRVAVTGARAVAVPGGDGLCEPELVVGLAADFLHLRRFVRGLDDELRRARIATVRLDVRDERLLAGDA